MKLAHFAVKHPVIIGMMIIVLATFGLYSAFTMNVSFMNDISLPSVNIIAIYPGAGAEDIEEEVTNILEADFVTIPDFKSMSSSSGNSVSYISITFADHVDPHEKLPEIRNRIEQKLDELPDGLQGIPEASVAGIEIQPIITFSVSAGQDLAQLTDYIENTIAPQITSISGVSAVETYGGEALQLNIKLRMNDLVSKSISVTNVYESLNYANIKLPVGTAEYETHNIDVRYDGSLSSIQDVENLPIGQGDGNVIIRLKDVADVFLGFPDQEYIITKEKESVIVVSVRKRSDGNVMDIIKQSKEVFDNEIRASHGAIQYEILNDDSRVVNASISTVVISGIVGVAMAILIVFLFLNDIRATFIIGISVPLSLLFTFIGMQIMGFGFNLITLSAMVLALGMIVDGSIVMIEQIYHHYGKDADSHGHLLSVSNVIFKASDEVGSSIIAGALTTIVVFVPIAFLTGLIGAILRDAAITLVLTISASLLVAIIVVPFLAKNILQKKPEEKLLKKSMFNKGIDKIEKVYKKLLTWSLTNNNFVLTLAVLLLLLSGLLIQALGIAFIPSTDNSDFYVEIEFPVGQSITKTQEELLLAESIITESIEEARTIIVYAGTGDITISRGSDERRGSLHVLLSPVADRTRRVQEIILEVQNSLSASLPDAKVTVKNGGFDRLLGLAVGGSGYSITLVSEDIEKLYSEAVRLSQFLQSDPATTTVNINSSFDTATYVMDMSHEHMSSLGISSYEAGITAAVLFNGMDIGRFIDTDNSMRYDIKLYSNITDNPITASTLSTLTVRSANGNLVSFDSLANTFTEQSMSVINHTDRVKTITISAQLTSEDTAGVGSRLSTYLSQNPLEQGVRNQAGGVIELIEDSIPPMMTALLASCFLVYTIMVLQFEKFRQPLLIMGTVPFSIIGVAVSLLLFGSTLNLMSLFGIISLAGIVVNNGIILVDSITALRKQTPHENGETINSLTENIVAGSASRLRPIFMTTLTTMLGVIPMAFSTGEGSEIYTSLGQAIVGGLFTSTLITLFIIPTLYYKSESHHLLKASKRSNKKGAIFGFITLFIAFGGLQQAYSQEKSYSYDILLNALNETNTDIQKASEIYTQSTLDVKDAWAAFQPNIGVGFSASYLYNYPMNDIIVEANSLMEPSPAISPNPLYPTGIPATPGVPEDDLVVGDFPSNNLGVSVSLTQPIFLWGKLVNSVKLYSQVAMMRVVQLNDLKNKLKSDLFTNLYALYFLEKAQEEILLQQEYANRMVELSKESQSEGVLLDQDVLQAQTDAQEIHVVLAQIQNEIDSVTLRIQTMTTIFAASAKTIVHDETFIQGEKLKALKLLQEDRLILIADTIELLNTAQIANNIANIQKTIAAYSMYWTPDIALQASFEYGGSIESFRDAGFDDIDKIKAQVSIALKTDIWDGGKKLNALNRSKSEALSSEADLKKTELLIRQSLNETLNTIRLANASIDFYNKKAETLHAQIAREETLYKLGASSEIDVLRSKIELQTVIIQEFQQNIALFGAYYTALYILGK